MRDTGRTKGGWLYIIKDILTPRHSALCPKLHLGQPAREVVILEVLQRDNQQDTLSVWEMEVVNMIVAEALWEWMDSAYWK